MGLIENEKIGIVGAGIAGSAVALELANQGAQVTIFDGKRFNGSTPFGQERSEMTLTDALEDLNATDAVTTPLRSVTFLSLDDPRQIFRAETPESTPVVAIDHGILMSNLHDQLARNSNVVIQDATQVDRIVDNPDMRNAEVVTGGKHERFKAVINAAGPGWRRLPFDSPRRQRQYEESTVAFAYGHRYKGRLLIPGGETGVLHPVSVNGSGRTSWVNASGNGTIEIIYSDYVRRREVGKVDRKNGFQKLRNALLRAGYVDLEEEGPQISGFFGLEPRRSPSGNAHVFHHGERGQYNSATVGDAIAPSVRLSRTLAGIILAGGTASDYYKATGNTFNHRLEYAVTQARATSHEVGSGFLLIRELTKQDEEGQLRFLKHHKLPIRSLAITLLKNPSLWPTIGRVTREYIKTFTG